MDRRFLGACLVVAIDMTSYAMLIPVFPYLSQSFWNSGLGVTLLMAVYAAMQFFFFPIWGGLSDRVGRRPVMLISILGSLVSYVILAVSTTYAMLLLSRVIAGIFMANIAVAQSIFADLTPPHQRTKGMAGFGVAVGISFVVGNGLGGWLAQWGYATVGWVSALGCLLNVLVVVFGLSETRWLQPSEPEGRSHNRVTVFGLKHNISFLSRFGVVGLVQIYLLFILSTSFLESSFSMYMKNFFQYSPSGVGSLLMLIGAIMICVQGFGVRPLTRRLGERFTILWGCLGSFVGLVCFSVATSIEMVLPSLIALGVGQGVLYISIIAASSRRVPAQHQGQIMGICAAVASLGRALGPIWAGFGYDHIMMQMPFVSGAVVFVIIGLKVWRGVVDAGPVLQER